MTCTDHVNSVVGKVYGILRNLRQSAVFTPMVTRRRLSVQLIVPIMTYSELVYNKLDSLSAHKFDVLFNNVTRYVYGLKKFDHISEWKTSLLGCEIHDFQIARSCIFLYRLMNAKTPSYLYDKLIFPKSGRTRDLIVPTFNFATSTRLFFINTIRSWNSIPTAVRGKLNKSNYKAILYSHFSRDLNRPSKLD